MKTVTIAGRPGPDLEKLRPGERIGRYVLAKPIGAGGMGVVWSARDPELDRDVAIKVVRSASLGDREERLQREAQAMARLSHPAVVPVFDVGTDGEQLFIAMELVDGDTLRRVLQDRSHRWREVLAMFVHAGRGLAAAHEAGIVHRDFKPENVLVGRDGRVQVTDFGLARFEGLDGEAATLEPDQPAAAPSLTRSGAVMGTPRYMAPEQHRGEIASTATDQFSFCVALWEGLYGSPPFAAGAASTRDALADAVIAGRLPPPPARSRVPARLRKIVARGLAVTPAERWPSMAALIDALEGVPRRRRRVAYGAAAALAIAALVIAWPARGADAKAMCARARAPIQERWNDRRRAAIGARLAATGQPGAANATRAIAESFDRYTRLLGDARVESCEATHVRGEQSAEQLDRRMECLDRRLVDLQATIDVIAGAHPGELPSLVQIADELPDATPCADAAMRRDYVPLPDDPVERARVELSGHQVAAAQAESTVGRYASARARLTAIHRDPALDRYAPLASRARFVMGLLLARTGKYQEAEPWLREAVLHAERGHADDLRGKALHELGNVEESQGHYEEAIRLAAQVRAISERIGDLDLEVRSLTLEANSEGRKGNLARAVELAQRALARWGDRGGDATVGQLAGNVGSKLLQASRYKEAEPYIRRGLALHERSLGSDDPLFVVSLNNLAGVLVPSGRSAEAVEVWRRGLAILERLGQGDGDQAMTLRSNIPAALTNLERFDEADTALREQLARLEARLGRDHRLVRRTLYNLGNNRLSAGDPAGAEPWFRDSLARGERAGPKDHDALNARWGLAAALLEQKHPAEALPLLLAAYPVQLAEGGDTSEDVAYTRLSLANAYFELGRPAEALAPAEAAQAFFADSTDLAERGKLRLLLARVLHCLARDPARVVALATQARPDLVAAGKPTAEDVTIADRLIDRTAPLPCPARSR